MKLGGKNYPISCVPTCFCFSANSEMCWTFEVSLCAALYGFGVSYFLSKRDYSSRDAWYAIFLCSFTLTQLLDAFFWYRADASRAISPFPIVPCDATNLWFTRIIVSAAIFSQVFVIAAYPTDPKRTCITPQFRVIFSALPALGIVFCAVISKCTTSWQTEGGALQLPTLVYWGTTQADGTPGMPPKIFSAGVALWSIAAFTFITPWWVATNILLVGGVNLVLLLAIDGTILLISKLCFYCLLLSILWLSEPIWAPTDRKQATLLRCCPTSTTKLSPTLKESLLLPLAEEATVEREFVKT